MSLNVVDNSNYGFTEGIAKAEAKATPFVTDGVVLNANNATTAGVYSEFVPGAGTNLPAANSSGVLLVVRSSNSSLTNDIIQVFFDKTSLKTYARTYGYDGWSSWTAFGA